MKNLDCENKNLKFSNLPYAQAADVYNEFQLAKKVEDKAKLVKIFTQYPELFHQTFQKNLSETINLMNQAAERTKIKKRVIRVDFNC